MKDLSIEERVIQVAQYIIETEENIVNIISIEYV